MRARRTDHFSNKGNQSVRDAIRERFVRFVYMYDRAIRGYVTANVVPVTLGQSDAFSSYLTRVTPSHVTAEFLASVLVRFWWRAGLFRLGRRVGAKNCVAQSRQPTKLAAKITVANCRQLAFVIQKTLVNLTCQHAFAAAVAARPNRSRRTKCLSHPPKQLSGEAQRSTGPACWQPSRLGPRRIRLLLSRPQLALQLAGASASRLMCRKLRPANPGAARRSACRNGCRSGCRRSSLRRRASSTETRSTTRSVPTSPQRACSRRRTSSRWRRRCDAQSDPSTKQRCASSRSSGAKRCPTRRTWGSPSSRSTARSSSATRAAWPSWR